MNKTAVDHLLGEIVSRIEMNKERREHIAKMALDLENLRAGLVHHEAAVENLKGAVIALGGQVPA